MEEILIGDKKYVSSKQAAKITGYAKDYIGQLCREGRVPARLVGRSWYVLESAIQDHRFGTAEMPQEEKKPKAHESVSKLSGNWESPRYEPVDADHLPSINRLRDQKILAGEESKEEMVVAAERLEESWRAWFDRFDSRTEEAAVSAPEAVSEPVADEEVAPPAREEEKASEEVHIPIRTIYQSSVEAFLPAKEAEERPVRASRSRSGYKVMVQALQVSGIAIALISASIAVANSGNLDNYIGSYSQASIITGVTIYEK